MALPDEHVVWLNAACTIHGLSQAAVEIAQKLPVDRLAEAYAKRFEEAAQIIRRRLFAAAVQARR